PFGQIKRKILGAIHGAARPNGEALMPATRLSIVTGLLLFPFILCAPAGAQVATTAPLAGLVSSAEEGPMEGVLVSARRDGATVTVTVVTGKDGRYSFPAG